jgi:hypothetical protein
MRILGFDSTASEPPRKRPATKAPKLTFVAAIRKNADAVTDKGGGAHDTTDSALVDLFFDLSPPVDPQHTRELLDKAFLEDPLS